MFVQFFNSFRGENSKLIFRKLIFLYGSYLIFHFSISNFYKLKKISIKNKIGSINKIHFCPKSHSYRVMGWGGGRLSLNRPLKISYAARISCVHGFVSTQVILQMTIFIKTKCYSNVTDIRQQMTLFFPWQPNCLSCSLYLYPCTQN